VAEIYRECGFCDVQVPEVPMSLAGFVRAGSGSLLEEYLDSRPEVERILFSSDAASASLLLPGDLIGFRIGRIRHHCGIYLSELAGGKREFVHAISGQGCQINSLADAIWHSRLELAWRPLAESGTIVPLLGGQKEG